ncbi:MAG: DUF456 domain-containing protein [Candidatus Cryptobacteroides sp.]
MDTFLAILAVIAGLVGIVGSIVPAIPGPPISWLGLLVLYFRGGVNGAGEPMGLTFLLVWLGIVVAVTVLDYVVPMFFTKATGGTKAGSVGTMVGMVAGLFIPPVGMILGAVLGAFLAEIIWSGKDASGAFKSAMGAFLGFITGTGMKLVATGVMLYYIIVYI